MTNNSYSVANGGEVKRTPAWWLAAEAVWEWDGEKRLFVERSEIRVASLAA
jgi:hypothetical protein